MNEVVTRKRRCPGCKQLHEILEPWWITKMPGAKKHSVVCEDCAKKALKAGALIVNY